MRYRARVQYDGTEFAGFQAQPGRRTVQGELERVLTRLGGGGRVRVSAAGRTDAGVHASGQVIAFTWTGAMPARALGQAIGALLPRDVSIGPLVRVPAGFDPRRAATRREYRYRIWNGPRSALRERYVHVLSDPLDIKAMQSAADGLVGRRDFSAYGRVQHTAMRTIYAIRVRRRGHLVTIDVTGDAFLRQMVRSIVAGLVRIGLGRATAADLVDALASPGRAFDGALVPAKGLDLRRVSFGSRQRPEQRQDEGERTPR